jgi:hypothetical protein
MTTVASRTIRSSPFRDSVATWQTIVDLLTRGKPGTTRDELLSIVGIASSLMIERSPENAPIVATCNGPRTRIYCLYDEDALDESRASEESLGYDPLKGNWALSLPCPASDLVWVQRGLHAKGTRITARDKSSDVNDAGAPTKVAGKDDTVVDTKSFFRS